MPNTQSVTQPHLASHIQSLAFITCTEISNSFFATIFRKIPWNIFPNRLLTTMCRHFDGFFSKTLLFCGRWFKIFGRIEKMLNIPTLLFAGKELGNVNVKIDRPRMTFPKQRYEISAHGLPEAISRIAVVHGYVWQSDWVVDKPTDGFVCQSIRRQFLFSANHVFGGKFWCKFAHQKALGYLQGTQSAQR